MKNSGRSYLAKYNILVQFIIKFFTIFPFLIIFFNFFFRNITGKVGAFIRYIWCKVNFREAGNNIYLGAMVILKNTNKISIGSNVSIHEFCYIDADGGIEIGNNVSIAHNCSLVSFEHTWDILEQPIKYNPTKLGSIKIGNDVWLGCGVRVLSGSVIEDRVIVAAGAVVKGNLESGYLYGGVPVRKLKKL